MDLKSKAEVYAVLLIFLAVAVYGAVRMFGSVLSVWS